MKRHMCSSTLLYLLFILFAFVIGVSITSSDAPKTEPYDPDVSTPDSPWSGVENSADDRTAPPCLEDVEGSVIAEVEKGEEPVVIEKPNKKTCLVKATAYNAMPAQTDDTPTICAWGDRVRPGIIAVSRDLEKQGLTRGREVDIQGFGKMVVLDRMHKRKKNQIDIYMEKYEDAIEFGVQELKITWNLDEKEEKG